MSIDACFWALLSSDNFEFIHVPELEKDLYGKSPQDILLSQSLLNFIHPDEIPLTKADLLSFMKIKSLAGAKCQPEQQWIMTDIIIYGIAGKTLLAFFHNTATNEENASGAALSEIKNGHRSSRFGCSYHTYSNSTATTLEPYGLCDIEKIIIHFGSIRFLSFQITPSESSYQKSNLERLPSIRELFSDTIPIQLDQVKQLPPITCLDKDIKPISTKPWQSRYSVLDKKCEHCHTCESPEWRKGPSGHKT
ncbi:hypothetical protein G6F56_009937 [Rhizopus delemar]|nr:hypothetical protein G6F56_009937 [Rhizopus delemar]